MKHIRIGKEITVRWPILTNGEPLPLAGHDLRLLLRTPRGAEIEMPFSHEGNILHFVYRGPEQHHIGRYSLTLYENFGRDAQSVVDCCNAFCLVASTCEERGTDDGLTTVTVELQAGSLEVGIRGESAYEIFKRHHPESALTELEYAALPVEAAAYASEAGSEAASAALRVEDAIEQARAAALRVAEAIEQVRAATAESLGASEEQTAKAASAAAAARSAIVEVERAIDRMRTAAAEAIAASEKQTARVAAYANHPPKIERSEGIAYWTFWDETSQRYAISDFRADDGMVVVRIEGPEAVLDTVGGCIYECGELTSLTLRTVEDSPLETVIRFRSGRSATTLACPDTLLFDGYPVPAAGHAYELSIAGLRAVIASFSQS